MKIGFLSDAHGNGPSLEKALSLMSARGVTNCFFLGDSIGYIPSLSALEVLVDKKNIIHCVRGNHEEMLLNKKFNPENKHVYLHQNLSHKINEYLNILTKWPTKLELSIMGLKILIVHGSPDNPLEGYVYPDTDMRNVECDFDWVFMGNTHIPFMSKVKNTTYVNVGSCGLPRDDGRFGSIVIFNIQNMRCEILRFDIQRETGLLIKQFPQIHTSTLEVFKRRSRKITGRIVQR